MEQDAKAQEANGEKPTAAPTQNSTQPDMIPPKPSMSADEIAQYDRQIRLWGVKAQEKIRTAHVLLVGLRGLGNEVAKNLALSGIGSLTLVDDGLVQEEDLGAQFLVSKENVGMSRAQAVMPQLQKLNPRVTISLLTNDVLFADTSLFGAFTVIIATDMTFTELSTINAACRLQARPFYAAATYGMYGYIFVDLIQHDFIISRQKPNVPTKVGPETPTRSIVNVSVTKESDGSETEVVTKRETYTPIVLANSSPLPEWHLASKRRKLAVTPILSCLRGLWEFQYQTNTMNPSKSEEGLAKFTSIASLKHKELQLPPQTLASTTFRKFLGPLDTEISPVCAFLGGQLAQDVINVVGAKEQPIQNMLIFDGDEFKSVIYSLHTDVPVPTIDPTPVGGMMPIVGPEMQLPMMGVPMMAEAMPGMLPVGLDPMDPTMGMPMDPTQMMPLGMDQMDPAALAMLGQVPFPDQMPLMPQPAAQASGQLPAQAGQPQAPASAPPPAPVPSTAAPAVPDPAAPAKTEAAPAPNQQAAAPTQAAAQAPAGNAEKEAKEMPPPPA